MTERISYFDKTKFTDSGQPTSEDRYNLTDATFGAFQSAVVYGFCRDCDYRHEGTCSPASEGVDLVSGPVNKAAKLRLLNNDLTDEGGDVTSECPIRGAEVGFRVKNDYIVAELI